MKNVLVLGLLALAPTVLAAKASSATADVQQWTLANGLKVVFVADHKAPVVSVEMFYHVGSKDEPEGKRGMAHMFEHMMFKGSTHVPPEDHARFIDAVGGNVNAFTADDVTGYHDTIPPAALDFTLKLEAERMRNLVRQDRGELVIIVAGDRQDSRKHENLARRQTEGVDLRIADDVRRLRPAQGRAVLGAHAPADGPCAASARVSVGSSQR